MMMALVTLGKLFFASQMLFAAPRTVMVQLFEWPSKDVARECEMVLGPQGYAAVQISPPQEHIRIGSNFWWERYQPVSYKISSRSGNENDFREMVSRCHAVGVDVYADVVINHMSAIASGFGFDGGPYSKYTVNGLYQRQDFHDCGRNGTNEIKDYSSRYEIQFCELLGLADLKTESEYVRNTLADYMNHLLDLGVAGFRIDAAKHIPAGDLQAIISKLKRPAYILSETFLWQNEVISLQEYMQFGDINFFKYSFDVGGAFTSEHITGLPETINTYPESQSAVVFIENHDLQRTGSPNIPSYVKDPDLYLLSHVFLLTWPYGYPQVFSGYEFSNYDQGPPVDARGYTLPILDQQGRCGSPWICEHRMPGMAALVRFHNETAGNFYASRVWKGNSGQLAYSRGNAGFAAINRSQENLIAKIPTDLPDGWYCNLLNAPDAGQNGKCRVHVEVAGGEARVRLGPNSALILTASARSTSSSAAKVKTGSVAAVARKGLK